MSEQWKPVVERGYEHYEVSDGGRVRNTRTLNMLKQVFHSGGYIQAGMSSKDGIQVTRLVHALVLSAFTGPRPEGMETRHLNGDKADNRLKNLAWGTPKQNHEDQYRHGTSLAALSIKQVHNVRDMLEENQLNHTEIGECVGASRGVIALIAQGKSYVHERYQREGRPLRIMRFAHLTVEDAHAIRRRYLGGESTASIAMATGRTTTTVLKVIRGVGKYAHI